MAKILVVDDDTLLRTVLSDALELAGYTVVVAADGHAALACAKDDPPDCILLDVNMPGLDGYQTCEALKADPALAPIPVLLVSATTGLRVVDQADRVGAAAILPKPVSAEQLQHAVALALATPPSS